MKGVPVTPERVEMVPAPVGGSLMPTSPLSLEIVPLPGGVTPGGRHGIVMQRNDLQRRRGRHGSAPSGISTLLQASLGIPTGGHRG
jgi:hypothetical protein